ncbi:MAG TPA: hypothetical protein VLA19_07535 [Herpetosiphonaceae bacterium]|nr:hypothetical protein [Herpetosiphonaceae bacterium]
MARHRGEEELGKAVSAAINAEVKRLSQKYHLEAARVRRVLKQTAHDYKADSLSSKMDEAVSGTNVFFTPSLDQALQHLPADEALALFEREDLDELSEREVATDHLADSYTLLYTIDELEEATAAFLTHLERNREALLKTGRPGTTPARSPWLNWHLMNLYPTKLLGGLHRVRDEHRDFVYTYSWLPPETAEAETCNYGEADLIEGLDTDAAARIEAGRAKLHDLKVAILKQLLAAVRVRAASNLWPTCLRLITDALVLVKGIVGHSMR